MYIEKVQINATADALSVHWSNHNQACFHALWLRDNCQDESSRHPGNGQRLFTILQIPQDIQIEQAEITDTGNLSVVFQPDGHRTVFSSDWLYQYRYDVMEDKLPGWLDPSIQTWDQPLAAKLPRASWPALLGSSNALASWLDAIKRYGFALLEQCPTHDGAITEVVERFGHVRETNYGRYFDVRSEINPINLAFTGLGLQVHSDNPYRDPVPGLQLLLCITSDDNGGESVVVDGFRAAQLLQAENPAHFRLLTDYAVPFEYRADGVWLHHTAPLITLSVQGEITEIRFNNRSQAPFRLAFEHMQEYYLAYRHFAEILERPQLEVSFRLAPGELFIVDNRRVLHGRKAFSGSGQRHLQGCYADRDALYSKLISLSKGLENHP